MYSEVITMNVKQIRLRSGMNQKEFASYFGINLRTLQEWEQGRRNPPEYLPGLIERILQNDHFVIEKTKQ